MTGGPVFPWSRSSAALMSPQCGLEFGESHAPVRPPKFGPVAPAASDQTSGSHTILSPFSVNVFFSLEKTSFHQVAMD